MNVANVQIEITYEITGEASERSIQLYWDGYTLGKPLKNVTEGVDVPYIVKKIGRQEIETALFQYFSQSA